VGYGRQQRMMYRLELQRTLPVTGRNLSIYLAVHGDVGDSSQGPLIEDADIGDALEMMR
jgi:hypothetical protein